jgi:enoyl-CoA hydratase/carnithine racemase
MTLEYEKQNGIGVFTITNGEQSIFKTDMYEPFFKYLSDFLSDDSLKVGILKGAPGKSFCAGDDLKSETRAVDLIPDWPMLIASMRRNKPIIGAVHGWCLGQGFVHLLTLTDIRIATHEAKFGFPEINYGMGGAGGATRLGRQIPHTTAMYLLMTGDYFSAKQAQQASIINEIVEIERLEERAFEIAGRISRHPVVGIRTEMESYQIGMEMMRAESMGALRNLYRMQRQLMEQQTNGRKDVKFTPMQQSQWDPGL